MRLDAEILLRAGLALVAVAFVWTAVAFLAIAANTLLVPIAGVAGAAALTAASLLAVVGLGLLINHFMTRTPVTKAQPVPTLGGANLANGSAAALAQLAKHHPLLAVGCAAMLGIADSMQSESSRIRRD